MTPPKRPLSLVLAASANLLVGCAWLAVYLFCGALQLALGAALADPATRNPEELAKLQEYHRVVREQAPLAAVHGVAVYQVGFVTSWMLIVSGIGLLALKRWGRFLGLAYAVVTLLFQFGSLTYLMAHESPRMAHVEQHMEAWAEKHNVPRTRLGPLLTPQTVDEFRLQAVVMTLFMGSYAIPALILMLLPGVRKGVTQPRATPPPVEPPPADNGPGEIVY